MRTRLTEQLRIRQLILSARARQGLDVLVRVAGEAIGLLHDRASAASIIESLAAEAESLLQRGASLDFRAT